MGAEKLVHSTKRDDYCTPPEILDAVREVGEIGLDPCASWNHEMHFAKRNICCCRKCKQDGLDTPWSEMAPPGKVVFCNPVYGGRTNAVKVWVEEAAACYPDQSVIALTAASTGAKWFAPIWEDARAICFVGHRVIFYDPRTGGPVLGKNGKPQTATFWSAVSYWGPEQARFASAFKRLGRVVWL